MRISYFGTFRESYSTENYITWSLRKLGHEVETIEESSVAGWKDGVSIVNDFKPDFVLFCKCRDFRQDPTRLMYELKKKYLCVSWIFDPYAGFGDLIGRGLMAANRKPPFNLDLMYMTDGGHKELYRKYGVEVVTLRQGIYEPEYHLGKPYKLEEEIIFVGTHTSPFYKYRKDIKVRFEKKYGKRFRWYGEDNIVRGEKLNDLFASVKIVLGDSLRGDNYWSNRIYETTGRGGFLVHPMIKGLEKEFEPYKEFVPYDYQDLDQLEELVDYFLIHDEEREDIRLAGHKKCGNFTYTKRCQDLIEDISKRL